jgi:hypothetical protein
MRRIRNGEHEDDGQQVRNGGIQDPSKQLDGCQFQDGGGKRFISNQHPQEADLVASRFCRIEGLERWSNQCPVEISSGQCFVASQK